MTDRALRYRSAAPACRPRGKSVCGFCGDTRNVIVHHIDGHEESAEAGNLMWACRSCNTRAGVTLARAGLGRRVRQFNPRGQGARNLAQWLTAVRSMKGESSEMSTAAAVAMIRATPAERRSEFGQEIWDIRRKRGTDVRR